MVTSVWMSPFPVSGPSPGAPVALLVLRPVRSVVAPRLSLHDLDPCKERWSAVSGPRFGLLSRVVTARRCRSCYRAPARGCALPQPLPGTSRQPRHYHEVDLDRG